MLPIYTITENNIIKTPQDPDDPMPSDPEKPFPHIPENPVPQEPEDPSSEPSPEKFEENLHFINETQLVHVFLPLI